jgi:flagellar hook-associated protein 1 FlgK
LDFTPSHGSFLLKVRNQASGAVDVSNLAIDLDGIGADTSLEDLRAALDAIDHVTAEITSDSRLRLTSDSGYELRFGNDTSGVLAALGINTFFTGSDSGNIAINDLLRQDQRYLATGQGGGPADNSNAIALAAFLDRPVDALGGLSLEDFHTTLIGSIAQSAAAEEALTSGFEGFRDSLNTQREQRSGVSLDEEAIRVMQLQRNYQAAARIVAVIDELLNTLLNV